MSVEKKIDFNQLAKEAFPEGNLGSRDKIDKLWVELFQLKEWLFLMSPKSAKQMQPSAQMIDGKGWLLVFTDSDKLHEYAKKNNNLDEKGNSLFLSIPSDKAREYVNKYLNSQVFGVRFNEGADHGWFSPVKNIQLIFDHLKKNKKL